MHQVLPKESTPIIFSCLFTTDALKPQRASKFKAYKKLNAPIILNWVCSVLLEPVHSFRLWGFFCFVLLVGGRGDKMLSISASNWKPVKQHHSRVIQQPLSWFATYHKTGLGKQQCLEEKEHTQIHGKRTIPERSGGNNPVLASEEQVGWPNRWLSMPFIPT